MFCKSIEKDGWKINEYQYNMKDIRVVFISRFDYFKINEWNEGCSPANHWAFYYPLRSGEYMDFEIKGDYKIATPKNEKSSKTYWGLKKVISKSISLLDITADNLHEKVFSEFDRLTEMEL